MLMHFLRREIAADDLEQAWKEAEAAASAQKKDLKKLRWECCMCNEDLPYKAFRITGSHRSRDQYEQRILKPCAWRPS